MYRLDKEVDLSGTWDPKWSVETTWQIEQIHTKNSFIADTSKRTCTCNLWELVRIYCTHAITTLEFRKQKPEDFVDDYYSKDTYIACYYFRVKYFCDPPKYIIFYF